MSLKEGVYEIRFVPPFLDPPFAGGVYATGETVNTPIRAVALGPHESQRWKVRPVPKNDKNIYIITLPGFKDPPSILTGPGPVLPGFGLREGSISHKELVILSVNETEFIIQLTDEKNLVGNIILPTNLVGATQAITEENQILYLESFPVIEHMPPLPRWQFIPVKD